MRRGRRKVENPSTARRILAAAEQHFAAQGMAGARTQGIASSARANKAMLYYYFGNKRRLHRAVLENLFRQLLGRNMASPNKEGSPRERLRSFITGYFDFLASHPNYPRLVQREALEASRDFDRIVEQYLRPFHSQLVRTIREGVAADEIRAVDPDHTASMILGMTTCCFAAPILRKVAGHHRLGPHVVEARKHALIAFLDHGLDPQQVRSR